MVYILYCKCNKQFQNMNHRIYSMTTFNKVHYVPHLGDHISNTYVCSRVLLLLDAIIT